MYLLQTLVPGHVALHKMSQGCLPHIPLAAIVDTVVAALVVEYTVAESMATATAAVAAIIVVGRVER